MRRLATVALAAQPLFALSWLVAASLNPGYSNDRSYVSELAGLDARHRWIVSVGIAALGGGWLALGGALRLALGARPRANLLSGLFAAAGALTLLIAVLPVDCRASAIAACRHREEHWQLSWQHYVHGFGGWLCQLLLALTPFALAAVLRGSSGNALPGQVPRLSRVLLAAGLFGLALGLGWNAAALADEPHAGIYQRAGLVIVQGWACALALLLLAASYLPSSKSSAVSSPT